jgi:ERAP1-like C-terminal domain
MEITAGACGKPIKLNFGNVGYYRVQYDSATEAALRNEIEAMAPADRVNLLADNWALVESNRIVPAGYLELVATVGNDDNLAVWQQVIATFYWLDHLERGLPARAAFQAYARSQLRPAFERLGWTAKAGEPEDDGILRAALIRALGDLGDPGISAEAKRRFDSFVKDPASLNPDLRDPVIHLAGRTADRATYDTLQALARKTTSTEERMRYYSALASATNPKLIGETLRLALTNELSAYMADRLIMTVAQGEHPELALAFVKANYTALTARQGPQFPEFFISSLMGNFTDRAHAAELARFAPAHETAGGRIVAVRVDEIITEAADFRERQLPAVNQWIERHRGGAQRRDLGARALIINRAIRRAGTRRGSSDSPRTSQRERKQLSETRAVKRPAPAT